MQSVLSWSSLRSGSTSSADQAGFPPGPCSKDNMRIRAAAYIFEQRRVTRRYNELPKSFGNSCPIQKLLSNACVYRTNDFEMT